MTALVNPASDCVTATGSNRIALTTAALISSAMAPIRPEGERSAIARIHRFERCRETPVLLNLYRLEGPHLLRRMLLQANASPPLPAGSHRPRAKSPSAIWTHVQQNNVDAVPAESAFVAADHGVFGVRGKIAVAVLAGRFECQHGESRNRETHCACVPLQVSACR